MTDKTADTAVEKKLPVLKEATATASAIINENSSIAKDGTVTLAENLFVKTLPENLTGEIVEAVRKHDAAFQAAGVHAIGVQAVDAFKANKDLTEITTSLDMLGGKELGLHVQNQVTYPGIKGAPDTTKHGVVTAKITEVGSKGSVGEMGKAKTLIQAHAAEALAKSNK